MANKDKKINVSISSEPKKSNSYKQNPAAGRKKIIVKNNNLKALESLKSADIEKSSDDLTQEPLIERADNFKEKESEDLVLEAVADEPERSDDTVGAKSGRSFDNAEKEKIPDETPVDVPQDQTADISSEEKEDIEQETKAEKPPEKLEKPKSRKKKSKKEEPEQDTPNIFDIVQEATRKDDTIDIDIEKDEKKADYLSLPSLTEDTVSDDAESEDEVSLKVSQMLEKIEAQWETDQTSERGESDLSPLKAQENESDYAHQETIDKDKKEKTTEPIPSAVPQDQTVNISLDEKEDLEQEIEVKKILENLEKPKNKKNKKSKETEKTKYEPEIFDIVQEDYDEDKKEKIIEEIPEAETQDQTVNISLEAREDIIQETEAKKTTDNLEKTKNKKKKKKSKKTEKTQNETEFFDIVPEEDKKDEIIDIGIDKEEAYDLSDTILIEDTVSDDTESEDIISRKVLQMLKKIETQWDIGETADTADSAKEDTAPELLVQENESDYVQQEIVDEDKKEEQKTSQTSQFQKKASQIFDKVLPLTSDSRIELVRKVVTMTCFIILLVCLVVLTTSTIGDKRNDTRQTTSNSPTSKMDSSVYPAGILDKYKALYLTNKNTVGHLKIPGTKIDGPVLQGEDNEYYLNHNFYGENDAAGNVFMDTNNDPKLGDKNTVLYANTIKNSQFGFSQLYKYRTIDGYKESPIIEFSTIFKDYKWKVYACFIINESENSGENAFKYVDNLKDRKLSGFVSQVDSRKFYTVPINIVETDKILTISVPYRDDSTSQEGERLVVIARLLREGESENIDM
jgi:sortase B